jgi:predicted nucleic acid-binding protein
MPTVVRILTGRNLQTSFANVLAIAEALGIVVGVEQEFDVTDFLENQAQQKAEKLVSMVQGTSGLEAQAVDAKTLKKMQQQTVHELLAGSPRKLWAD